MALEGGECPNGGATEPAKDVTTQPPSTVHQRDIPRCGHIEAMEGQAHASYEQCLCRHGKGKCLNKAYPDGRLCEGCANARMGFCQCVCRNCNDKDSDAGLEADAHTRVLNPNIVVGRPPLPTIDDPRTWWSFSLSANLAQTKAPGQRDTCNLGWIEDPCLEAGPCGDEVPQLGGSEPWFRELQPGAKVSFFSAESKQPFRQGKVVVVKRLESGKGRVELQEADGCLWAYRTYEIDQISDVRVVEELPPLTDTLDSFSLACARGEHPLVFPSSLWPGPPSVLTEDSCLGAGPCGAVEPSQGLI